MRNTARSAADVQPAEPNFGIYREISKIRTQPRKMLHRQRLR